MCSNYAVDGDEVTFIKRILKDIYPNTTFSIVLDSYDYWNIIDNVLPSLKTDILNHNGCMLIRGDSGDCVEVVTKTVFKLWDTFGGTINEKGFKVLDPHIKATYGDSITIERCQKIFEILKENGFACSNVSLGVGSFSFNCVEEEGDFAIKSNDWSMDIPMMTLKPFTRDTFSLAFKSTYCEVNGKPIPIFKNPKEGGFKKSQKGCCIVKKNVQNLTYTDEHTWEEVINSDEHMFECIFRNGVVVKKYSLEEVRDRLNGGQF
jgi:nicotinamide phosphoribosyltransferase